MNKFETFANIVNTAISNNIITTEQLKTSPYHAAFWLAAVDISTAIVNWNYNKLSNVNKLTSFEKEDHILEFAVHLTSKYETIVKAVSSNPSGVFNYNAYISTAFTYYLRTLLKTYQQRQKTFITDADGKKHYVLRPLTTKSDNDTKFIYYNFISTSTPISDEAETTTLEDALASEARTPEDEFLFAEALTETPDKLYNILKTVGTHRNKLPVLAILNLVLKLETGRSSSEICSRICAAAAKPNPSLELINLHNREVKNFINYYLIPSDDAFYAKTPANFTWGGNEMSLSHISAALSRALYIAKLDLAILYGIKLNTASQRAPKKYV